MVSWIVELLCDGVPDKVVRQSLNDYFCQEQMIKGGVWHGLKQDFTSVTVSEVRHKTVTNQA